MEQLRIEIGENIPILGSDYSTFSKALLTDSFVRDTWKFMSEHQVQLIDGTKKVQLLRENDACIMEQFRINPNIPPSAMANLNKCRIYLKAFTLSDLGSGDGKRIRNEAWHGRQYNNGRPNERWPLWGRPSLSNWANWRTALKSTFCTRDIILRNPLGK